MGIHALYQEKEDITMSLNDSSPKIRFADSSPALPTIGAKRRPGRPKKEDAGMSSVGVENKQSIYFGAELLAALKEEASRQDRSLSWLVARLCTMGLPQVREMPGMSDTDDQV